MIYEQTESNCIKGLAVDMPDRGSGLRGGSGALDAELLF